MELLVVAHSRDRRIIFSETNYILGESFSIGISTVIKYITEYIMAVTNTLAFYALNHRVSSIHV